jgi:hypothetical protein
MATILPRLAANHGLSEMDGWEKAQGAGFSGHFDQVHGLAGWVMVGDRKIAVPDVYVIISTDGISRSGQFDLVLGGPAFADGLILFNVPAGKIYIMRPSAETDE